MNRTTIPLLLLVAGCAPESAPEISPSADSAPAAGPTGLESDADSVQGIDPLVTAGSQDPAVTAGASRSVSPDKIGHMVAAEDWIVSRTPAYKTIKTDLFNLELPGGAFAAFVDDDVFAPTLEETGSKGAVGGERRQWKPTADAAAEGQWWPVLDEFLLIDRVQVGTLDAGYELADGPRWTTRLKIVVTGRLKSGATAGLKAKVDTTWAPSRELPGLPVDRPWHKGGKWKVTSFETLKLELTTAERAFFDDDLARFVADEDERAVLSSSGQDEILIAHLLDGEELPDDFALASNPGLAVVDVNSDGFDDLYVMPRNRRNRLLVNRGDGTFVEDAAAFGLDLPGGCTSAAFADFDNDGDLDLLLGRVRANSQYFERRGQRFVDRTAALAPGLPTDVSAISVADFDGNGLLDAYFATYSAGPLLVERNSAQMMFSPENGLGEESINVLGGHYFDLTGPVNVLALNHSGRFEVTADCGDGQVAKHSFGASASDWDLDGDQDLYCANDFAPDTLLENDGTGRFTDISDRIDAPMGFGMGASWGDYDGDGDFDVYVSNMYSKAGTRISKKLPGIGQHIGESATGNFLLRNVDGRLELASDNLGEGEHVSQAGWSYCSQFVDLDNDRRLDIVAPNGFFSAPPVVARDDDW